MFGVLGNPQKDPSMQNIRKIYIFWAILVHFWGQKLAKICKNEHFQQKWGFLDFFTIFATFLDEVLHREHIGTIFRPFWVKNWAKIDKNQHFSAKWGFLNCFLYFATLLGGVCHKGHTVRFL